MPLQTRVFFEPRMSPTERRKNLLRSCFSASQLLGSQYSPAQVIPAARSRAGLLFVTCPRAELKIPESVSRSLSSSVSAAGAMRFSCVRQKRAVAQRVIR
jgi:hypothetical protein